MAGEPEKDARYPIGKFEKQPHTKEARAEAIKVLEELPAKLRAIVGEWNDEQLDTPYREGGWTARQLIHHIADSHTNMVVRVRLALTEDWPTIKPYDQKLWAALPDAKVMPVEVSLAIIEGLHERMTVLLRSLLEDQWKRGYNHPESGKSELADVVPMYAWHSMHHTAHLTEMAKARGW